MNYMCPDELNEFYRKWKSVHGDTKRIDNHNVYFLKTVDKDGNVTGEAFALNVTLKEYFRARFSTGSSIPNYQHINMCIIGNGVYADSEDVSTTDTGMRAQTYTGMATFTLSDMTRIDGSTVRWDPDNGVLWANCKVYEGYFDYVLSGISGDLDITEIGLGNVYRDYRYLYTHALLYDNEGHRTTFTKHTGEKLIVTAYVRIFHKPELETRMWNKGYAFMWNPWACIGFGESNGGDWHYASGQVNAVCSGMISSPRYINYGGTGNRINYYDDDTSSRASIICKKVASCLDGTWDDTNQISTRSIAFTDVNSLIESKDKYYDMFVAVFLNSYYTTSASMSYCSQGAIFKPIELPSPESIEHDCVYCRSIASGDVSVNFGYVQNSKFDARGTLPVANMNVSYVKSYNGLTHDWDIEETLTNGNNTTNLTMFQLYPWCGIYMYGKYKTADSIEWGRQFDRIYANLYTAYPITSFDTTAAIFCTDTYWDTTSWEYIPDNKNVSVSQGTKKYYIRYDGSSGISPTAGPSANLEYKAPMLVTRSGYTIPTITIEQPVTLSNIDPYSNGAAGYFTWGNAIMMTFYGTCGKRVHLSNDEMGYIYMSNKIYYPDLGMSFDIVTSGGIGNCKEPVPTLRFTEPTGHRVLQVFRSSNNGSYFTPQLSKVSVFDIPSASELEQDPTLTPTEYIVDVSSTFPDNIQYDSGTNFRITSTETGYVIFSSPSKAYVINLNGRAPDYEPYAEAINYPWTSEPNTSNVYAIKYTNNAVMIDYKLSTETDYVFTIFSLDDGSVVDRFTLPKNIWNANSGYIDYIVGWKGYLFITGPTTSSWDGEWQCMIYDPTRPADNRAFSPGWSSDMCKFIAPGSDVNSDTTYRWNRLINPHIYGDQSCIIFSHRVGYNCSIYYIDDSNISSIINITGTIGGLPHNSNYSGNTVSATVLSFNDNKQRLLCINTNYFNADNNCLFMDLNLIRDTRRGPTSVNISSAAIPATVPYVTSGSYYLTSTSYRTLCTYKGKVVISDYTNTYHYNSNNDFVVDTANMHRFVDPNSLIQHKMAGTTTTIQAYNNPKRIYGINNITLKYINDAEKWYPPEE